MKLFNFQFHSSGWIIEPANRDNKLYSMVTYIVQVGRLIEMYLVPPDTTLSNKLWALDVTK